MSNFLFFQHTLKIVPLYAINKLYLLKNGYQAKLVMLDGFQIVINIDDITQREPAEVSNFPKVSNYITTFYDKRQM